MIISISGKPGSGKSTVAKLVAKKLGFKHYSIGDLMGEIAVEKGVSLLELSRIAEKSREIDELLDKKQSNLGKTQDNFVIDSRLGWQFIPRSVKIFLDVDLDVGAQRVYQTKRSDEAENISIKKTKENIAKRIASEKRRYRRYYDLDYFNKAHYDYVADTSNIPAEKVVEEIVGFIKRFK